MRMPRSSHFLMNPSEKNILARMAMNGSHLGSFDRGNNSDGDSSASLEEISAEDFRQDGRRSRSRVWDGNMMGYSIRSSFGPTLYSFAWAQAVQNKPLGLEVKTAKESQGEALKEGFIDAVAVDSSEGSAGEVEKEEGELEEGEIDMETESVFEETVNLVSDNIENDSRLHESETHKTEDMEEAYMEDFDRRVAEILEGLDTITSEEAEASLEGVCSRLLKSFSVMKTMFEESHASVLDVLVQQAFMGIQTLYSVFCFGNLNKTKHNMDLLLRLLIHIKNQYSALLTQEQITEIDSMAQLLVSNDVSNEKTSYTESPCRSSDHKPTHSFVAPPENPSLKLRETGLSGSHSGGVYLPNFESFIARSRVEFSPLLDLHADYDEGSLPSPTRENAPSFQISEPFRFGTSALSHVKKEPMLSYTNNALKSVSSYQQKHGQTSTLPSNQLPSPTPSEECNFEEEENYGEVSSTFVTGNAKSAKVTTSYLKPLGSGSSFSSNTIGQLSSPQNEVVKVKSRDPRLRFINHNAVISSDQNVYRNGCLDGQEIYKKHKVADNISQDGHSLKRKRLASTASSNFPLNTSTKVPEAIDKLTFTGSMEAGLRKTENSAVTGDSKLDANSNFLATSHGKEPNLTTSSVPVSLPSLLKDMDISPAMLLELIKMKQHGLAADTLQKPGTSTAVTVTNELPGSFSSVNGVPLKPMEMGLNASFKSQKTQNDAGRLRMKPRDPRRFLHDTIASKVETSVHEQSKMVSKLYSFQVSKDKIADRDPTEPPQIINNSWQLSKNAKIGADNLFTSKITSIASMPPPDILQPIISTANKPDGRITMGSSDSKAVKWPSPQTGTGDTFEGGNPWGDVDYLLNGYDDQQKAAIQKERSRRIDEQNKMFAARKLCLVLDLDHTLLNSAKFGEVDIVHEEILRKKEEQDREQCQRHLFRFSHMAMWTKLRPGVWNFLEKASKIYELHLYTMGNKLYATEMAKVLDPTGTLFSGRVISRGDEGDPFDGDERVPKSKDLEGVLGMESAVVIMDDSVRVWPHNRHNLILVERYTYFPCSRRQFGLLGPSLLEIDHDERPEDGTLASCLGVIEKLHQIFFSHNSLNDVDVRHILATEQRKILGGCKIVFSRIFPVGEANPHLHPLWQTAEQFGAVCTTQVDEQVTHVVANSPGTDKVNWALSTGRHVVHPGWVEASALLYRRANENDFAVKL